ncbi:canalicular multispecific organic anion transporter 1, partial [Caerostris extrusa]
TGADIWLSKWSADALSNGTRNASQTIWRLSIYGDWTGTRCIFILGNLLLIYAVTRACERFHRFMLDSVLKSPMSFFDTTPTGRIVNRFTTDLEILDNQLFYQIGGCLNCIFSAIACFIVIGMNTPIFSSVPYSTGNSIWFNIGVSSISAYGAKNDFIQMFEEKLDRCLVCTFNNYASTSWLAFCLNALGSVIIFVATMLAIQNRHTLNPAFVGLVVSYSLGVTDALKWFVSTYSELENKSISVERIDEYCHLNQEAPWDLSCEGLSDEWPQNEKVGIIGRTGAGKSSITLSLFRIIEPTTGTIKIDDIDITKIGLHNLRSKLTIIPQDPILFNGSLRMNLDPNNEYSDEEIWASLEKAYLKTFVSNLNEALEHDIEEGGSNLSAGQRQLNTIRTAFADRTVITIAHRINTVLDYDKIVILESGDIVEVGKPTNLLENENSRFYLMNQEAGLL